MHLIQNIKRKSIARNTMILLAAITLGTAVATDAPAAGHGGGGHGGGFGGAHMGGGFGGAHMGGGFGGAHMGGGFGRGHFGGHGGLSAAALRVSTLPWRTAASATIGISVTAGVSRPAWVTVSMTTGAATATPITTATAAIRRTDVRQHQRPASRSCHMRNKPRIVFAGPCS
jgi:hypothetical protein